MREHLSPGQARVLDALRRRAEDGAPPPTYRELCDQFGWKSTGTARDHLQALAKKGYVELADGRARQTRLIEDCRPVTQVPILGRVVAGIPDEAVEDAAGMVPVPRAWTSAGRHFALTVDGDSMVGAGILDGDLVVVRATPTARDGDVVVATIEGETTVKRLSTAGSHAMLVAENPAYRAIPLEGDSVVLHGVVVGVLRQLPGHGASSMRVTRRRHA